MDIRGSFGNLLGGGSKHGSIRNLLGTQKRTSVSDDGPAMAKYENSYRTKPEKKYVTSVRVNSSNEPECIAWRPVSSEEDCDFVLLQSKIMGLTARAYWTHCDVARGGGMMQGALETTNLSRNLRLF